MRLFERTELAPLPGQQQSFYGKAKVIQLHDHQRLESYDTPIMDMYQDGSVMRLWGGWSNTTGRHIKAFCGMTKKEFCSLPIRERVAMEI